MTGKALIKEEKDDKNQQIADYRSLPAAAAGTPVLPTCQLCASDG